jgi:hypothetical protein
LYVLRRSGFDERIICRVEGRIRILSLHDAFDEPAHRAELIVLDPRLDAAFGALLGIRGANRE